MREFLAPRLYFFISYNTLKKNLIHFAEQLGCIIEDGFSQQTFDPNGFALIDDNVNPDLIHRLANKISILAFSETLITPLAVHHLNPTLSLTTFKKVIFGLLPSMEQNGIHDILIGQSSCWQIMVEHIELASKKDCTVVIQGESGTGKEIVAKTIHQLSSRSKQPFVPVNCGAIPADLVESELFGHEKGSFTGAVASRAGKFEAVTTGTLFLDEIGDMPMSMQVKLLRVLQEKKFERVGSNKFIGFQGRLISATHQILSRLVEQKLFREDLFYRLNVLPIYVPPLRERLEDIPCIIDHIVQREMMKIQFSSQAIAELMLYHWPGNVRQLINLLERAEVFYGHITLEEHHVRELLKYEPQHSLAFIEKNNTLISSK
jgi:transcriptional regulator with GAF, ATPase, and Fis domain